MRVVTFVQVVLRPIDFRPMIEETTTYQCRKCESANIVKNGKNVCGNQQYHCKDCGAYGVLDPTPRGYSEEEKKRILQAYHERGSMRAVERIFGVSRPTLSRWLKKRDATSTQSPTK
jgi:transposase-like protein